MLGLGALGIVAVIWAMWPEPVTPIQNPTSSDRPVTRTTATESVMVDAAAHPAMRSLVFLGRALKNSNHQIALNYLDLDSWLPRILPKETRKLTFLSKREQQEFETLLFKWLDQQSQFLTFDQQTIVNVNYRDDPQAELAVEIRTSEDPEMRWLASFRQSQNKWLVFAFRGVRDDALTNTETLADAPKKPKGPYVETNDGGRILAGTIEQVKEWPELSGSERNTISDLIDVGVSEGGLESKLAREDLKKHAPQCIPQILNRIVMLPLDGTDDRLSEVAALDRILQTISGRVSTIPMRTFGGGSIDELLPKQEAAVAAWFTWWKMWANNWKGWREKTGLPDPNQRQAGRTR